jgi:hypothetical protein
MTSADLSANLKKHPIGVACALVSIACGVWLYIRAGDIASNQSASEARTAEATKMINNVRNSAGLAEQTAEMEAQRKEFETRLMKASQLAVNLQYFYKLEAETEVKLVDVRQNATPRNTRTQYIGVPFVVTIQGSFAQITSFVNRLQNGPQFCRITTASFNKVGGETSNNPEMSLSLALEILGQP